MTAEDKSLADPAMGPAIPSAALAWVVAGYRALGMAAELDEDASGLALELRDVEREPTRLVPLGSYVAFLGRALRRRASFAVDAGARCPFGTFPLLDCTIAASPSLRSAIDTLARYFALVSDRGSWHVEPHRLELRVSPRLPEWFRVASLEFGLHYTAARFDELVERRAVVAVEVPWSPPPWAGAYPRATTFDATRAALVLDESALDAPSRRADPLVAELLEASARDAIARLPTGPTVQREVRDAIVALVPGGLPGMREVARRLETTERTLRRRLAAEGLTFAAVRDEVLCALARERLADPRASVADVAFALGFAELRAFHRAFVRWTGMTPGAFRRSG
ncbi:MAG: AraC family transcriptional regulator [Myxococcota bacterium]|jgi:AraC-like DNA-binding protein|nr:AraC family transcriptional regulator [Myxococcota bacterium]